MGHPRPGRRHLERLRSHRNAAPLRHPALGRRVEFRLGSADPVAACVLTSNRTLHVTGNRLLILHVAARDTLYLVRPPARELLREATLPSWPSLRAMASDN